VPSGRGVPVQVHGTDADPIFVGEGDIDAAGPGPPYPPCLRRAMHEG